MAQRPDEARDETPGAGYEPVEQIVAGLPQVSTTYKWHRRHWEVAGRGFVWERPLSKADVKRWRDAPLPEGPLLGVRTEDLHEREAILAEGIPGVFSIQHFDGYPAFLVDLAVVEPEALRRLVVDAWLSQAPEDVARAHLAGGKQDRGRDGRTAT